MQEIKITASYETRKSAKTGNNYDVLVIVFPNGYKHDVFMDNATQFAVKQNFTK